MDWWLSPIKIWMCFCGHWLMSWKNHECQGLKHEMLLIIAFLRCVQHSCGLWMIFLHEEVLSRWSGHGYKVCPTYNKDTPSLSVKGKNVYFSHRLFCPWLIRWDKAESYLGNQTKDLHLKGLPLQKFLDKWANCRSLFQESTWDMGNEKKTVDGSKQFNCRKKSIFFELDYWSLVELRHNLDVMHVKK